MALTLEEQKRQEDLQRLRGLRPIDDDFMRCLFKDNIPLVELVLRIITGKPDLIITNCQTQKDMKRLGGARSICLDAYGTDTAGKKYDMEIQREDKNLYSQPQTPCGRVFFRHTALRFLEIHKVFPRKRALSGEKIPCPPGIFDCEYRF